MNKINNVLKFLLVTIFVSTTLFIGFIGCKPDETPSRLKAITFADETLESAIRDKISKSTCGLYESYLENLTSFSACDENQPEYWLSGDSPALDELKRWLAAS